DRGRKIQRLPQASKRPGKATKGFAGNIWAKPFVRKQGTESSFPCHGPFPQARSVPRHFIPPQTESINLFEGRLDLVLDGKEAVAQPGDLIRLPMNVPHGIFNKSDQAVKCFFWVSPTRRLYDLFWAIHSMKEQKPEEVVALSARHEVNFL